MFDHWLSPVSMGQFNDFAELSNQHWGKCLQVFHQELPQLNGVKIALIGVGVEEADEVRRHLYAMSFPFKGLSIADLGNVRKTSTQFLIPLVKELLNSKIIPIIIGNQESIIEAQYLAYQSLKQLINLVTIDEKVRYYTEANGPTGYLNQILENPRSHLFHLGVIGYQSHYTPPLVIDHLQQHHYECTRLGYARAHIEEIEPLVRDADLFCFNIASLRQSEAPGQAEPSPCGFFTEEACQISRYAGMSDKVTSAGFYGYRSQWDQRGQTAQVVAQLIWYFVDGFYNRKNDYPSSTDSLVEYIVDFRDQEYQLTFWKSNKSGRWWMQVPVKTKRKHQRHTLIPCSYQDYQLASREDLPQRLLDAYKRFM